MIVTGRRSEPRGVVGSALGASRNRSGRIVGFGAAHGGAASQVERWDAAAAAVTVAKRDPVGRTLVVVAADVDAYIDRSESWPDLMSALRPILLDAGLDEAIKWGKPCYGHDGSNIVIMQEMKRFLALMFFKGALIDDTDGVLEDQGPNSRSARRMTFTSVDDVERLADTVRAYVGRAIEVEEAGLEVEPAPAPEWADELRERLDRDVGFRTAFESLTPGRQREYNLHISSAKQSTTRASRVEKCAPAILAGKGLRDR